MIIKRSIVNEIPITSYSLNDGKIKPLIYFFHGFTSDKDSHNMGRGEQLALMGFYVVAIDAYLHGLRQPEFYKKVSIVEKYYDIIDCIIQTAEDAKTLFDVLIKELPVVKDKYYAYGISMGAATALYLGQIDKRLMGASLIVPLVSFVDYYLEKAETLGFIKNQKFYEKIIKYRKLDPLINYQEADHMSLFMGCGIHDTIVNPKYAEEFFKLSPHNKMLKHYDTGHISTPQMLEDAYLFLKLLIKDGQNDKI